jgi:phosphoglycerate dehydrogenase-like enzyme
MITREKDDLEKVLDKIEIGAGDFPQDLILKAPVFAWCHQWFAGADWLNNYPGAKELPFQLTNVSGIHGAQMTEHLLGLLIAWYRKFPYVFASQQQHKWDDSIYRITELLAGKTMVILGLGVIGGHVAKIADAFDVHVIGVRRTAAEDLPKGVEKIVSFKQMFDVLPEADIVVDILPCTAETAGLMNAKAFSAMKKTAIFANIGRGPTVNENDLVEAIRGKTIAGAVLDVTVEEPLPPESPLWTIPEIIITPHYSGTHPDYDELAFQVFLDNLKRYVKGEPLRNVVDKNLGY